MTPTLLPLTLLLVLPTLVWPTLAERPALWGAVLFSAALFSAGLVVMLAAAVVFAVVVYVGRQRACGEALWAVARAPQRRAWGRSMFAPRGAAPGLLVTGAVLLAFAAPAQAQRDATTQAFERMEEALTPEVEEGSLSPDGVGPILLVSAKPAYEETQAWFPVATLETLIVIFGRGNIRVCEACLNPRVKVREGRLEHNSVLSLPEISSLDKELRGNGAPARSAIWVEETPYGVAIKLVAIDNGQVLFAGNFDGKLRERTRTSQVYNATLETGRRLRGESLTHIFLDFAVLPNQHVSMDICEQFGDSNKNLAGISLSVQDPFGGIGAVYYRVIPAAWNLTVGGQIMLAVPTTLVTVLNQNIGGPNPLFDPIVTGVLVARLPIPSTNLAVVAMASTSLRIMFGITLMNVSFLPFLP